MSALKKLFYIDVTDFSRVALVYTKQPLWRDLVEHERLEHLRPKEGDCWGDPSHPADGPQHGSREREEDAAHRNLHLKPKVPYFIFRYAYKYV